MPPHHPSEAQYQSATFSGYRSQGYQQSFQSLEFSSYMPQYSFQVPSISNVFDGPSQRFDTTFNTSSPAYNLPPSSSCYRPSLPTQMLDMSHEDEDEDENDDNNNTNNNDDDDDDDNNGGDQTDHVSQQQHTITCDHPRTRECRGHRTRGQQTHVNPVQQDDRPRHISRRTRCGISSDY